MSSTQAGVTPVEALARPQATARVASSSPSPAVLRSVLASPVSASEQQTASVRLAQYRPGTTQQVRPIPVPQSTTNTSRGYTNYQGYGGYYYPNQQQQLSIGATISKDGVTIGVNKGPTTGYYNQPGGQATYHMVVYSQYYGWGDVRAGGIIPVDAIPQREYQWWNPGDWFLRTLG